MGWCLRANGDQKQQRCKRVIMHFRGSVAQMILHRFISNAMRFITYLCVMHITHVTVAICHGMALHRRRFLWCVPVPESGMQTRETAILADNNHRRRICALYISFRTFRILLHIFSCTICTFNSFLVVVLRNRLLLTRCNKLLYHLRVTV